MWSSSPQIRKAYTTAQASSASLTSPQTQKPNTTATEQELNAADACIQKAQRARVASSPSRIQKPNTTATEQELNAAATRIQKAQRAKTTRPASPPKPSTPATEQELNAAASCIQKAQRAKLTRKKTQQKIQELAAKSPPSQEQRATTVAEVWESLTIHGKTITTRLDVVDFVDLFARCRKTGFDSTLVRLIPMHFSDSIDAEDLMPVEFAHLCTILIENSKITEEEVREQMALIKDSCRDADESHGFLTDFDAQINQRLFRRALELTASLMRIDLEYFVAHIAWLQTGVFETTDTIAALLVERGARKCQRSADQAAEDLWAQINVTEGPAGYLPNLETLKMPFTLDNFTKLLYNANIIDAAKAGLTSGDMQLFYKRVNQKNARAL